MKTSKLEKQIEKDLKDGKFKKSNFDKTMLKNALWPIKKNDAKLNMRVPEELLEAYRELANELDTSYQTLIRNVLIENLKSSRKETPSLSEENYKKLLSRIEEIEKKIA